MTFETGFLSFVQEMVGAKVQQAQKVAVNCIMGDVGPQVLQFGKQKR